MKKEEVEKKFENACGALEELCEGGKATTFAELIRFSAERRDFMFVTSFSFPSAKEEKFKGEFVDIFTSDCGDVILKRAIGDFIESKAEYVRIGRRCVGRYEAMPAKMSFPEETKERGLNILAMARAFSLFIHDQ